MTKSRKIAISVAFMLIFVLACAVFVPLYSVGNTNVADAVNVQTRDEWTNPYNGTYYDNLNENLTGSAFRTQLAKLIGPTSNGGTHKKETSYDYLKTLFKTSDADPNKSGNIIWFYTGTSHSYDGTLGSSANTTNREHVWAKTGGSTFDPQSGPGSDGHHLRPTESLLNNARSNYGFAEVSQSNNNRVAEGNSYSYGSTADELCYLGSVSGGTFFYPAKGYRGATARILMYMQVRWGDEFSLDFVDGATTNNGKSIGKITDLFKWHLQEPPTDEEIRRNNVVAAYQGNRNPFIDHPEYAEMIYCNGYNNSYSNKLASLVEQYGGYLDNDNEKEAPTSLTLSVSSLNLTVGAQSAKITVTATPSGASNKVTWTTSNSSVATVSSTGIVTAVSEGTAQITATSTRNSSVSASLTVTVAKPAVQSLTISPSSLSLMLNGTRQLTVSASPSGASNSVSWSSSNSSVATVSSTGLVTAVSEGTATITATSTVNSAVKATLAVTVVSEAGNKQLFENNIAALDSAKTLQDRFNAIQGALAAYNQMSASTKQQYASQYAKLQAALEQYNKDIARLNNDAATATDVGAQTVAFRISVAFMAVVVIVVKRLFGR